MLERDVSFLIVGAESLRVVVAFIVIVFMMVGLRSDSEILIVVVIRSLEIANHSFGWTLVFA